MHRSAIAAMEAAADRSPQANKAISNQSLTCGDSSKMVSAALFSPQKAVMVTSSDAKAFAG